VTELKQPWRTGQRYSLVRRAGRGRNASRLLDFDQFPLCSRSIWASPASRTCNRIPLLGDSMRWFVEESGRAGACRQAATGGCFLGEVEPATRPRSPRSELTFCFANLCKQLSTVRL